MAIVFIISGIVVSSVILILMSAANYKNSNIKIMGELMKNNINSAEAFTQISKEEFFAWKK